MTETKTNTTWRGGEVTVQDVLKQAQVTSLVEDIVQGPVRTQMVRRTNTPPGQYLKVFLLNVDNVTPYTWFAILDSVAFVYRDKVDFDVAAHDHRAGDTTSFARSMSKGKGQYKGTPALVLTFYLDYKRPIN